MARTIEFDEDIAIRKAMDVFWEKGYNGASLRDLTDAMKINSSSLYNTIGDKQELFVRCVAHYTDLRKKDLQKRMAGGASPRAILVKYINDAIGVIVDGGNGCMAVKTAFEVGGSDKRVKEILKADSDYSFQFLYSLIKAAIDEGEISTEEDPELLAEYFISTWIGWNESFILHRDAGKIRKMAQFFIRRILG